MKIVSADKEIFVFENQCPLCNGEVWDNTAPGKKLSPKSPDYKCKSKECNQAYWIQKDKPAPKPPLKDATEGMRTVALLMSIDEHLKHISDLLAKGIFTEKEIGEPDA